MHKSTVICEKKKHVMKRKSHHLRALRWRHNGCDGVSNHQPHDCLLNSLFGCRSEKHQSSASLAFVLGIHREPVNSLHKWPVTRKKFPFDDVIMGFSSLDAPAASHLENFRGLSDENFARMTTSASRCVGVCHWPQTVRRFLIWIAINAQFFLFLWFLEVDWTMSCSYMHKAWTDYVTI